jgi:uncharacterized protein YecT (DUF1311 family)
MRLWSTTLALGLALTAPAAQAAEPAAAVVVSAASEASVPATPGCGDAATQAAMNACAHDDFLAANAQYAERYRLLSATLTKAQRDRLRKMQDAWLRYRTEACRFEAGPSAGGSIYGFVYWSCVARMTHTRASELAAQAQCSEGDLACGVALP